MSGSGYADIAERMARMEARWEAHYRRYDEDRDRAAEERKETRAVVEAMRDDIAETRDTVKTAVDQIEGGRKVLAALWVIGGLATASAAWASGLVKALLGLVAK